MTHAWLALGRLAMNESVKLASEVAHRILECHYGINIRENSQLFTDLAEMVSHF